LSALLKFFKAAKFHLLQPFHASTTTVARWCGATGHSKLAKRSDTGKQRLLFLSAKAPQVTAAQAGIRRQLLLLLKCRLLLLKCSQSIPKLLLTLLLLLLHEGFSSKVRCSLQDLLF
jgi:hypothetical protein